MVQEPNDEDSLSRVTVAVFCPTCGGAGLVPDPSHIQPDIECEDCYGGGHYNVNRGPDGGVPAGFRGWVDYEMPEALHEGIADAIATSRIRERWG